MAGDNYLFEPLTETGAEELAFTDLQAGYDDPFDMNYVENYSGNSIVAESKTEVIKFIQAIKTENKPTDNKKGTTDVPQNSTKSDFTGGIKVEQTKTTSKTDFTFNSKPRATEAKLAKANAVAGNLDKDTLLEDYKKNARDLLSFRVQALIKFADIVVRSQIKKPEYTDELKKAGTKTNELAKKAWLSGRTLKVLDYMEKKYLPPLDKPVHYESNVYDTKRIKSLFNKNDKDSALRIMGYPDSAPSILSRLNTLGTVRSPKEEQIVLYLLENTPEETFFEKGFSQLMSEGRLLSDGSYYKYKKTTGSKHITVTYKQLASTYRNDVIGAGVRYVLQDEDYYRPTTKQLLENKAEADPAELAVMDSEAAEPAYTFAALRYVINQIRAEKQEQLGREQMELGKHLDRYPLLRIYIDKWESFVNDGLPILFDDIFFHNIIDINEIKFQGLREKLDQLLDDLKDLKEDVLSDEDYLFDKTIYKSLTHLLDYYKDKNPNYKNWIDESFESNEKWKSATDKILNVVGILGFAVSEALTGGWATVLWGAGFAAFATSAVRTHMKAEQMEDAAAAGLVGYDEVAVAKFHAWLETAGATLALSPALKFVTSLSKGMRAVRGVSLVTRAQLKGGTISAELKGWLNEIQKSVNDAVKIVDSGKGTTAASKLYQRTQSAKLTGNLKNNIEAAHRGGAIHAEASKLINKKIGVSLPENMLVNQGIAVPKKGFINKHTGRPDFRISTGGNKEAIIDITTLGQAGKASQKYNKPWVSEIFEIYY